MQTQVLPYLRELRKGGINVSFLTFEPELKTKWTAEEIEAERKKLSVEGIDWKCLSYHKQFSVIATAYDIACGVWFVRKTLRAGGVDVLHGRVHVPTLMAALGRILSGKRPKLIFDIRGFFPEEYTDAGVWPEGGMLYRSAKRIEKWLLKEADGFVVLTNKARDILFPESKESGLDKNSRPVEVIPCCVDMERFATGPTRKESREAIGVNGRYVIAYVGSFGGWYLTEQMMDLFETARRTRPETFALILTQRDKDGIREQLKARGFADSDFLVESVSPSDIPKYLPAADVAISFIKSCYSKLSSSPTKIAEYLACGLPIVANTGVGDVDEVIESNGVGAIIQGFSDSDYVTALATIEQLEVTGEMCRDTARREYDLAEVAGVGYRRLYERILR